MSARTKARKKALDVLFEADVRGHSALDVLVQRRNQSEVEVNPYTVAIVEGVAAHLLDLDESIAQYSQGWTLDRMPAVDRNLLRIGAWELMFSNEVPDAVAISEAVTLAAELSTDDSPAFVNGLLSRIKALKTA